MSYEIKQSSTSYPLLFLMVDSSDHVSAKTGLSPTVTLSKAGGSFASPSGAVTEIANGWYKVAGNSTDSGTLGPLVLHATGTGADPVDVIYRVVAHDVQDAVHLGLSSLPNVACDSDGGLLVIGTGTRQVNPNAGGVPLTTGARQAVWDVLVADQSTSGSLGKLLKDYIDAAISSRLASASYTAPLDAAGVRSAVGLASANLDTQLTTIDDFLDTEIAEIKAKTDNLPSDPADASDIAAAFSAVNGTLSTIAGYIDTEVAAIKAKTDNLPASFPANFADLAITSSTGKVTVGTLANNVITTASIQDGAITDAKITVPTPASGLATGILGMVQQVWRRAFKKTTFDSSTGLLKTYADDGTAVYTTETCTEVSNTQTKGAAS